MASVGAVLVVGSQVDASTLPSATCSRGTRGATSGRGRLRRGDARCSSSPSAALTARSTGTAPAMVRPVLTAEGWRVGARRATRWSTGIDLELRRGEVVAVLGPTARASRRCSRRWPGCCRAGGRDGARERARGRRAAGPALAGAAVRGELEAGARWWGVPRASVRRARGEALERAAGRRPGGRAARRAVGRRGAARAPRARDRAPSRRAAARRAVRRARPADARRAAARRCVGAARPRPRDARVLHDRAEAWALADRADRCSTAARRGRRAARRCSSGRRAARSRPSSASPARCARTAAALVRPRRSRSTPPAPLRGVVARRDPEEDGVLCDVALEDGTRAGPHPYPGAGGRETVRLRLTAACTSRTGRLLEFVSRDARAGPRADPERGRRGCGRRSGAPSARARRPRSASGGLPLGVWMARRAPAATRRLASPTPASACRRWCGRFLARGAAARVAARRLRPDQQLTAVILAQALLALPIVAAPPPPRSPACPRGCSTRRARSALAPRARRARAARGADRGARRGDRGAAVRAGGGRRGGDRRRQHPRQTNTLGSTVLLDLSAGDPPAPPPRCWYCSRSSWSCGAPLTIVQQRGGAMSLTAAALLLGGAARRWLGRACGNNDPRAEQDNQVLARRSIGYRRRRRLCPDR